MLHARGMPVSGTKSELIARLSNKKKKTVPTSTITTKKVNHDDAYVRLQNTKTHDGKCIYMHPQMPGKRFQKVLDSKSNKYKFREYRAKTQKGGYLDASNTHICNTSYDPTNSDVFPLRTRGPPYVIENGTSTNLKLSDYDKPILSGSSHACWDSTQRKWVSAEINQKVLGNAQQRKPMLPWSRNEW